MSGSFSFTFAVKLTTDPEAHEYVSGPAEMVRFERKFDMSVMGMLGVSDPTSGDVDVSALRIEHLTYLAWSAWMRGRPSEQHLDYDAWLDKLEDFDLVNRDAEEDLDAGIHIKVVGDITPDLVLQAQDQLNQLMAGLATAVPTQPPGPETGTAPSAPAIPTSPEVTGLPPAPVTVPAPSG